MGFELQTFRLKIRHPTDRATGLVSRTYFKLGANTEILFFHRFIMKMPVSVLLKFKTTRQAVYSSESPLVAAQY